MSERDIMQENLTRLFNANRSYASCQQQPTNKQPLNPFQKRVFEKKIKRSSVNFENRNPNLPQHYQICDQPLKQQYEEVAKIINSTKIEIQLVHQRIIKAIKQEGNQNITKIRAIIQNLRQTMGFIENYAQTNSIILPTERHKTSVNHFQSYRQSDKSQKHQPPSYFKNKHKLDCVEESQNNNKVTKISRIICNKQIPSTKKSVYQMILEERRSKINKNKKMI